MTVLSMHHWQDRERAFREINRITTTKFVAITWDPSSAPFWLTSDYFPEIYAMDKRTFPELDELTDYFDDVKVTPVMIPRDCKDGVLAAFWARPEAYLSSVVRQSTSPFSKIKNLTQGLTTLADDLNSGLWAKKNHVIVGSSSLDVGYKIISAKVKRK